jgi:UDP-N-acetyl-D-galactosamine dehydrogenase
MIGTYPQQDTRMMNIDDATIAIIGLGYVGLPLAVAFGQRRQVVGFDVNAGRISELASGVDRTLETDPEALASARHLSFTADPEDLKRCGVFIVTVPTPIDRANRPDLNHLREASAVIGKVMGRGAIVIYESTVYPGATEEVCVPLLEAHSGLRYQQDFFCGYSPERINPGDKTHRLENVRKITSGSTPEAADAIDRLYLQIVAAGTHKASSIRVAEAAKVIENTQRDVNIALINELALIFQRMGLDTTEVLEAAGTKWNFLPFRPGLVGGHCIGVDPYYLTHKAQELGYHPEVILAGRRINDSMGAHIAERVVKLILAKGISVLNARVLVLGLAFKENCPDVRNSKVVDIVRGLEAYRIRVDTHDPWVDPKAALAEYGIECLAKPPAGSYDAIVLAVAHREFVALGPSGVRALGRPGAVVFDVKSALPAGAADGRL